MAKKKTKMSERQRMRNSLMAEVMFADQREIFNSYFGLLQTLLQPLIELEHMSGTEVDFFLLRCLSDIRLVDPCSLKRWLVPRLEAILEEMKANNVRELKNVLVIKNG